MAYPVTRSNGKWFTYDGEQLAFAVVEDGAGLMNFGLFRRGGDGLWYAIPPLIDDNITSAKIMAYGSVAKFLEAQLPVMHQCLADYLKIQKPNQDDKPSCVGYDLALDVDFDAQGLTFKLNKEPPLSHAR